MVRPESSLRCQEAADLGAKGKLEQAWKIVNQLLIDDPMNIHALVTGSYLMRALGALPQAYHMARSATQIDPTDDASWTNLGHAASLMWLPEEAERAYLEGLKHSKKAEHQRTLWLNLSALYLDNGRFAESEKIANTILEHYPDYVRAQGNLGFCQLARGDWAQGWKGYRHSIGEQWRQKMQFTDEPEWDGTPGKTVVLYGEQGLGDEINFASMIPDAQVICHQLIVECSPRLQGLFRRSFPGVKVYGTRQVKPAKWDPQDVEAIEASLPLGQAGEYFRTSVEDFPGHPYLIPCPNRTAMWAGLWKGKCKPVIGLAWTGGLPHSNARNRKIRLEDFIPLFNAVDAHYVCLQYKDAQAEIDAFKAKYSVDIEQYPYGTLTQDYDDTAALVASLDYVLCIQTAVGHTAAALGVPVTVLIPKATTWRYGTHQESIPWYDSMRCLHQSGDGWRTEIERATAQIRTHLARVPASARDPARDDQLRGDVDPLRPTRIAGYKPNGSHAPS